MIKFFHYPICPLSRQIRVYLTELNLEVSLVKEAYWERREDFIRINPGSTLPVIIFGEEAIIGYYAITEFLSEKFDNFYLMPKTIKEKVKYSKRNCHSRLFLISNLQYNLKRIIIRY